MSSGFGDTLTCTGISTDTVFLEPVRDGVGVLAGRASSEDRTLRDALYFVMERAGEAGVLNGTAM